MTFQLISRAGNYYRICGQSWTDPSDTSFSKTRGGRWNPPDREGRPGFGALYLNASIEVARGNARRHARESFGLELEDLVSGKLPDLQHYDVAERNFVDAISPSAIALLGLADTYAMNIPHPPCQGIAEAAYAEGTPGLAVLSAVISRGEELVVFDRDVAAVTRKRKREAFASWFYSGT